MRKVKLLKKIIDIIYYIYAIGVIAVLIAATIIFIVVHTHGMVIDQRKYIDIEFKTIFWFILNYIIFVGFFYCLFLFRKIIDLFLKLEIFCLKVIKFFKQIGKLLVIIGLVMFSTSYFPKGYSYITSTVNGYSDTHVSGFNFEFLNFTWIIVIGVGLFFQILSEIFKEARHLKQENELTV